MEQGKQVLVNNSGSVIFSACWFIFSLEPSVPWKRHFRSWASGRGRSNRPLCQGVGSPQGLKQPVIQTSRCSCKQEERAGRLRDIAQACLFNSLGRDPERSHPSMEEGFPQAVCPSQTGRRKGPREEGYRNSSAMSRSPRGRSSVLCVPSISTGPISRGGL